MKKETLIKYLEFLKLESKKHQNDKVITNDEINLLEIEIKRFIDKVNKASLSKKIKDEITTIDFNLNSENHNKSKYKWLSLIGGFEGREIKNQLNRKNRFEKLYNDVDTALFKIKTLL